MSKKTTTPPIKVIPKRINGDRRIYSNHVEISLTEDDLNIKFCDIRPPENEKQLDEVKKAGEVEVPIDAEVVIPLRVAIQLKKILNERIKETK